MNLSKILGRLTIGICGLSMIFNTASTASADEARPGKKIVINSASRLLTLYRGDTKLAVYPTGLGRLNTPTPVGYFQILTKEIDPPWIDPADPEYEIPSGPDNPLGYRWMQIFGNYGIHGTNRPDSIGHYASNGCIRMREADVEALFKEVEVGTPVDITYNRVVVEKTDDNSVAYYIYPDGYNQQKIDAAYVGGWLAPYGVLPFETDRNIEEKIRISDGKPTYVGKPYNIELDGNVVAPAEVNGKNFIAKGVISGNVAYLPVVPMAMALKTKLEWRASAATLKTAYGTVVGYESREQLYCNVDDAGILFNIDGGLQNISDDPDAGKIFRFVSLPTVDENLGKSKDKDKRPPQKPDDNDIPQKPDDNESPQMPEVNEPPQKPVDETEVVNTPGEEKPDKDSKKKSKKEKKSKKVKKSKTVKKNTDVKV